MVVLLARKTRSRVSLHTLALAASLLLVFSAGLPTTRADPDGNDDDDDDYKACRCSKSGDHGGFTHTYGATTYTLATVSCPFHDWSSADVAKGPYRPSSCATYTIPTYPTVQLNDVYNVAMSPEMIAASTYNVHGGRIDGPIGVALDGVLITAPFTASGDGVVSTFEDKFSDCYGWVRKTAPEGYFYARRPGGSDCGVDDNKPLSEHSEVWGIMADGIPIFGVRGDDGIIPTDLDDCGGHVDNTHPYYHYHSSSDFPHTVNCLRGCPNAADPVFGDLVTATCNATGALDWDETAFISTLMMAKAEPNVCASAAEDECYDDGGLGDTTVTTEVGGAKKTKTRTRVSKTSRLGIYIGVPVGFVGMTAAVFMCCSLYIARGSSDHRYSDDYSSEGRRRRRDERTFVEEKKVAQEYKKEGKSAGKGKHGSTLNRPTDTQRRAAAQEQARQIAEVRKGMQRKPSPRATSSLHGNTNGADQYFKPANVTEDYIKEMSTRSRSRGSFSNLEATNMTVNSSVDGDWTRTSRLSVSAIDGSRAVRSGKRISLRHGRNISAGRKFEEGYSDTSGSATASAYAPSPRDNDKFPERHFADSTTASRSGNNDSSSSESGSGSGSSMDTTRDRSSLLSSSGSGSRGSSSSSS